MSSQGRSTQMRRDLVPCSRCRLSDHSRFRRCVMVLATPPTSLTSTTLERRLTWYADVARLAPSKHNTQPWQFMIRQGVLEVHAEPTRSLPSSDPDGRELRIGCGAAVRAAEVAAAAIGARTTTELHGGGLHSCLAEIREGGAQPVGVRDREMLAAVSERRTDRGPLDATGLDPGLPFRLQNAAGDLDCVLRL